MESKNIQRAGDNSQQIQAQMVVVNQGIEEKRAREIFMEMFENARKEFSNEAVEIARQRVFEFEKELIPRIQKIDGALEQFAEPAFQMMLTSAHKTAATTDNKDDFLILSELLIHRIKRGNDRNSIVGIRKAIEIVNEVPEDALLGLTVMYTWKMIVPESGEIKQGLDVLDDLFSKLIYEELPKDMVWLEQLDILNAIRIADYTNFISVDEYYAKQLDGYCCVGIKKETDKYREAVELLRKNNLESLLVEHELNEGYVRLSIISKNNIEKIEKNLQNLKTGKIITENLSETEKLALYQVYDMYEKDTQVYNNVKNNFKKEIENRNNLLKLKKWIESIPKSFVTTPVGKVLAHANAQKIAHDFPALD